jgi:hypothetical protein
MKRWIVPAGLLGVLGIAVLVWFALHSPEEAPADVVETDRPASEPMDPEGQRVIAHKYPYPFAEFAGDFETLQKEWRLPEEKSDTDIEIELWKKLNQQKFTVRMENAKFPDLIKELDRQAQPTGIRIFSYPGGDFPEDYPLGDIVLSDVKIDVILADLMNRTSGQCLYYPTSLGLVIGKTAAVQQAQIDSNAARAEHRSAQDRKAEILKVPYQPKFDRWSMPVIVRDILAQTQVEVIPDAETWTKAKVLTWRANPMPLAEALDHIARHFGAYYRVKGGRVFLIRQ